MNIITKLNCFKKYQMLGVEVPGIPALGRLI
jgi:hypothetical protein